MDCFRILFATFVMMASSSGLAKDKHVVGDLAEQMAALYPDVDDFVFNHQANEESASGPSATGADWAQLLKRTVA